MATTAVNATTWPSGQASTLTDYYYSPYYSDRYSQQNGQTYPGLTPSTWATTTATFAPAHEVNPDLDAFLKLAGITCSVQTAWLSQDARWTIVLQHEDRHQMTANTHEENPDEFIRAMASFYMTCHFLKAKP